jgi:HlyD family secretion protein
MRWYKAVIALLLVAACAAVTLLGLRDRPPPAIEVTITQARRGSITRIISGAGKVQPATTVKISANISGDLIELRVKEADRVTKGQVLGRIDRRRFEATLKQALAAQSAARAEAQLAEVEVGRCTAELARVRDLNTKGLASATELERGQADLDGARAQVAAAEQRLAQADAALREARHQFSLTTITSPMDGIVTQRLKQVGERVRGSDFSEDVIMVIATLSKMEMKAEIGEHEVVYVKEGDQADVEIDAFPERKFKAQVVEVARKATVKNAGTEQEVTTFIVRMALLDVVPGALPGMSAQASVATDTREDAVVVPIAAVTVRPEKELAPKGAEPADKAAAATPPAPPVPGKKARKEPLKKVIFVVQDGVARLRQVETGLASDTEIEIVSGLQPGERVVEGPYRALSKELADGKKVKEEEPGKKGEAGKAKGS